MQNDLNHLFDKKNLQKTFCEKCQKNTDHKNGIAWNHDFKLYYRVLRCTECNNCLKKEISYESFKEEEKFLRLLA